MKIKITVMSAFVMFIISILVPINLADLGTKVVEGRQGKWFMDTQGAVIDANLAVLLDPFFISLAVEHDSTAQQSYEIRIVATHYNPSKMKFEPGKYQSLSYTSAEIEVRGNVKKEFFYWNPLGTGGPDNQAGNGLAFISISATTNVDKRNPPIEERPFTIIVHLKGVKAKTQGGEVVSLGDVDAVFKDKFRFYHDPAKIPKPVISGGGMGCSSVSSSRDPEKIGTETFASGPTPVPQGGGWKVFGQDTIEAGEGQVGIPYIGQPTEPLPFLELLDAPCLKHRKK